MPFPLHLMSHCMLQCARPIVSKKRVFVHDLNQFVTVHLLEETPAVLSVGKLCKDHGYSHSVVLVPILNVIAQRHEHYLALHSSDSFSTRNSSLTKALILFFSRFLQLQDLRRWVSRKRVKVATTRCGCIFLITTLEAIARRSTNTPSGYT